MMQKACLAQNLPSLPQGGWIVAPTQAIKPPPLALQRRTSCAAPARLAIARHPPSGGRVCKAEGRVAPLLVGRPPTRPCAARWRLGLSATRLPPTSGRLKPRGREAPPQHHTRPPEGGCRAAHCAVRAGGGGEGTPKASVSRCGLPSTMQRPASAQNLPSLHRQEGDDNLYHPGLKVTPAGTATAHFVRRPRPASLSLGTLPRGGGYVRQRGALRPACWTPAHPPRWGDG